MRLYTSPTLQICSLADGDKICCVRCGYALGNVGSSWKINSLICEIPTESFAKEHVTGEPAETLLRQFICGGCGALLDAETALPGDPYLEDMLIL